MPPDFSGQNLRGRNFKGQDLTAANFSHADIQGANFTNADLREANFTHAKAGLHRRWAIACFMASFVLLVVAAFFAAVAEYWAANFFISSSHNYNPTAGIVVLGILMLFFTLLTWQGLETALGGTIVVGAGAGAVAAASAVAVGTSTGAATIAGASASTVAAAGAVAVALSLAIAVVMIVVDPVASAVVSTVASTMAIAGTVAAAGAVTVMAAVVGTATITVMLLSSYVAWRALNRDQKYALIRDIAVAMAAVGGTSFREANLTDAIFTQAKLKSSDFRRATVTQTLWRSAKQADLARVGGTLLQDADVQDLLVTGQGRNKRYGNCNLKGANLSGAELADADFTEADLSGATLEGASLERANLTKTQALGTNFHQANLTGACLEAWNIDSTTQLDGAICEYVYLLSDQRERRPSSGNFAPGEFTKLFQTVLSTLDLIFRNGIDWKAFTYSFNQLVLDNEGTELSIQSIENKGDGVVVVRVNAPLGANKAKLHSEFNQTYDTAIKALEAKYHAELKAKDEQITIYRQQSADMQEITRLMASRPVTVEVNATAESKSMNDSTDSSRNIQVGNIGGDFNASGAALNLGEISGTVSHTINQLQTAATPTATQLAELLKQLQTAIESEPNLPPADKTEALEQLSTLAKAGQNPQDGTLKKLSSTAVKVIKGTIAALPSTASLVQACSELLPTIIHLLGL
ncbi:MAG TPA: pentapeptide repeat-containing protein [Coleofasciculaceae cyanobacterium]